MPYEKTGTWLQDVEDEDVLNHEVQIMMDEHNPIVGIYVYDNIYDQVTKKEKS